MLLGAEAVKMRLTNQKIKEAVEEAVGKDALPIVEYLKNRRNISDFKIAEKTNMRIQKVRNLLYQLYANGVVSYIRRKDPVKGWYISYFSFNPKGTKHLVERLRKQNLEKYKERLEVEENGDLFFICPNLCVRLNLDNSTDFEFHCPECGDLLKQQDNRKTIKYIKERIRELEVAG